MASYPGATKSKGAARATRPSTVKMPSNRGKASDKDLAARVHRQVAYSPKPFPKQS